MGKKADLTPRKIGQIKTLLENTQLNKMQIAKKANVSQSTIFTIKKRLDFQGTASPQRAGRCGRPRKTTPQSDRWLARYSLKNRRLSSRQLSLELRSQGVAANARTVRWRLQDAGIKAYRPLKKSFLNARMKRQRLEWAKHFKDWTADDWSRVSLQYYRLLCFCDIKWRYLCIFSII